MKSTSYSYTASFQEVGLLILPWCCVERPVLTQRESLVSQAHVGLGG